jgi:hypothetical protein
LAVAATHAPTTRAAAAMTTHAISTHRDTRAHIPLLHSPRHPSARPSLQRELDHTKSSRHFFCTRGTTRNVLIDDNYSAGAHSRDEGVEQRRQGKRDTQQSCAYGCEHGFLCGEYGALHCRHKLVPARIRQLMQATPDMPRAHRPQQSHKSQGSSSPQIRPERQDSRRTRARRLPKRPGVDSVAHRTLTAPA